MALAPVLAEPTSGGVVVPTPLRVNHVIQQSAAPPPAVMLRAVPAVIGGLYK